MCGWERQTALSVPAAAAGWRPGQRCLRSRPGCGQLGGRQRTRVTSCFKGMWEGGITVAMAGVSVSLSVILQQQRRVGVSYGHFSVESILY